MSNKYSPTSYYFVDPGMLSNAVAGNKTTDSYGPVNPSSNTAITNQFRTTSFVRATGLTKVFAICKGQILIQPNTGDNEKINLILKPDTSTYSPLKIKYFIYRGIRKADLIAGVQVRPKNPSDPTQPIFLQKLWDIFTRFHMTGATGGPPIDFPVTKIGFDPTNQADSSLLDSYFYRKTDISSNNFYQLPPCNQGDHIGNFSDVLGLDIVLDDGSYKIENQRVSFQFDLAFARANENILDVTPLSTAGSAMIARYRENVHQFMDAAAFWGSHIVCGKIKLNNHTPASISSNADIFNLILRKYQTANKLYVYIKGERNRSYNFYNTTRVIKGLASSAQTHNITNGWPILIRETPPSSPTGSTYTVQISLEYNIANNPNLAIDPEDRYIYLDVISPNNDITKYPLAQNVVISTPGIPPPAVFTGDTNKIVLKMQIINSKYCSSFLMIFANLTQDYPLSNYYDELWPVNFNTAFALPDDSPDLSYWATYDRNRLINLTPQLNIGAAIQNKVFLDTGHNPNNTSKPTKSRRLYMAVIKGNTNHTAEYNKLGVDKFFSGISNKKLTDGDAYSDILYTDNKFSTFKGSFTDNSNVSTSIIVDSLSLIHNADFNKKNSFFLIGITGEDYNKLIYDNADPTPETLQNLPNDADNVFFHLEEVTNPNTNSALNLDVLLKDFKKYKVGLKYEDNTGTVVTTPLYPTSPSNDVYVYTLDGYYFFSKDYSAYQNFYQKFANAKVEFRTKIAIPSVPSIVAYEGEFGFDWIRMGDNGDYTLNPPANFEPSYGNTIRNGYHRPSINDTSTEFQSPASSSTPVATMSQMAYKALKQKHKPIPTSDIDDQYYTQYLSLYSSIYSNVVKATYPPNSTLPIPPNSAELRILVTIKQPLNKLEFDYDQTLFTISPNALLDNQVTSGKIESINKTITITCLKDFAEDKQIRVLAYPIGVNNKKDAQLAGIIMVSRNDVLNRTGIKVVLVKVQTNIKGNPKTGSITNAELNNLYYALHQMLFAEKIEISVNNLDLSNDRRFKIITNNLTTPPTITYGKYIYEKAVLDPHNQADTTDGGLYQNYDFPNMPFYNDVRNAFINDPQNLSNKKYRNYFTVFSFDDISSDNGTEGQVQTINIKNVALFQLSSPIVRDNYTLHHECLHGLGLYHTHQEVDPQTLILETITHPEVKFVFPHAFIPHLAHPADATDNIMSYSAVTYTLWHWQWQILKDKLAKK